jgi:hypothetical protein
MPLLHAGERIPEVPVEQQTYDVLLKRARKLRWIGLEEEADRTQRVLCDADLAGSILTLPRETD